MRNVIRLAAVAAWIGLASSAAADTPASKEQAKLEEGRRALVAMRDNYAYVLRKEQEARDQRDPVKLNNLHQIGTRIADMVAVAQQSLEDMRIAIASQEPGEATDAELEKITLIQDKVRKLRDEADRSQAEIPEDGRTSEPPPPVVDYTEGAWNLSQGAGPTPPAPPSFPPGPPPTKQPASPATPGAH